MKADPFLDGLDSGAATAAEVMLAEVMDRVDEPTRKVLAIVTAELLDIDTVAVLIGHLLRAGAESLAEHRLLATYAPHRAGPDEHTPFTEVGHPARAAWYTAHKLTDPEPTVVRESCAHPWHTVRPMIRADACPTCGERNGPRGSGR